MSKSMFIHAVFDGISSIFVFLAVMAFIAALSNANKGEAGQSAACFAVVMAVFLAALSVLLTVRSSPTWTGMGWGFGAGILGLMAAYLALCGATGVNPNAPFSDDLRTFWLVLGNGSIAGLGAFVISVFVRTKSFRFMRR